MRRLAPFILMLSLLGLGHLSLPSRAPQSAPATAPAATQVPKVTFMPVHVYIDPQGKPLACYEVEIIATRGDAKLVGIEGGEDPFGAAPYYDQRALAGNRVIIGAYTLDSAPPGGKMRAATLSFQVTGPIEPQFRAILRVAASTDERSIPAAIVSLVVQSAPRQVGTVKRDGILRGVQ